MCLELETVTVSQWFLWLDESNVFRSEFFCNESLIFEKNIHEFEEKCLIFNSIVGFLVGEHLMVIGRLALLRPYL